MIPGERILEADTIELNVGRETLTLRVDNLGDKPIQVGSHTHFFEVNKELSFDRARTYGFRLDVPAGTALRFEPGEGKEVTLVTFGGARRVYGMNGLVIGDLAAEREAALGRAKDAGFAQELAALDPAGCVYTDEAGVDDTLDYACGQARKRPSPVASRPGRCRFAQDAAHKVGCRTDTGLDLPLQTAQQRL